MSKPVANEEMFIQENILNFGKSSEFLCHVSYNLLFPPAPSQRPQHLPGKTGLQLLSSSQLCYHRGTVPGKLEAHFLYQPPFTGQSIKPRMLGSQFFSLCLAHRAEVLHQMRQAEKTEAAAPTQHTIHKLGVSFQEKGHCSEPLASEQWLRDFAQEERHHKNREL